MDDPFSRLLEAIAVEERRADDIHTLNCDRVLGSISGNVNDSCDCGEPDRVLRRCAADRRMVKLWQVFHDAGNASTDMHIAADQFLRHLAEGYGLSDHQEGEE